MEAKGIKVVLSHFILSYQSSVGWQATNEATFIITPATYQGHFTVNSGAFQLVGVTLAGNGAYTGGITVNGATTQLGTQNVVFSSIQGLSSPINVQTSLKVHVR